jgi:hypothetical protein
LRKFSRKILPLATGAFGVLVGIDAVSVDMMN